MDPVKEWYYGENGQSVGPVPETALPELAAAGKIRAGTLVWTPGMDDWVAYGTIAGSVESPAEAPESPPTIVCSACGRDFPQGETIYLFGQTICADCKPVYVQCLREGVTPPGMVVYGGFWIRFAARFIDGILLSIVNAIIVRIVAAPFAGYDDFVVFLVFQVAVMVTQLVVGAAYTTFFVGKFGATPGKMVCRLRIIKDDGSSVTYWRAFGRHFGEMVSGLTLNIGYIMAAFDAEKRALHDHICSTRVIRTDT